MSKYHSASIVSHGIGLTLWQPESDGTIMLALKDGDKEIYFKCILEHQNMIIQHFINFNPDCENTVLRRVSYEINTMQGHLTNLIKAYRELEQKYEDLKNGKS